MNSVNTSMSSAVAEPIAHSTEISEGQFKFDSISFVQTVTAVVTDGKYEFSYNKTLGVNDYIELSLPTFDTSKVDLRSTIGCGNGVEILISFPNQTILASRRHRRSKLKLRRVQFHTFRKVRALLTLVVYARRGNQKITGNIHRLMEIYEIWNYHGECF